MKHLIFLFMLLPASSFATITNMQAIANNTNCNNSSGTTCAITTSSSGSGDLAVFCAGTVQAAAPSVPTQGGSWTLGLNLSANADGYCWYNLNLTSGNTTVSVTVTSNNGRWAAYYEWSTSLGFGWVFDNAAGPTANAAQTNPPGQAVTLHYTSDVILQSVVGTGSGAGFSAINNSYNNLVAATGRPGSVYANLLNTSSGAAPTWTNANNATSVVACIAFEELQTSSVTLHLLQLLGVGR
jgi:hypothetical protein